MRNKLEKYNIQLYIYIAPSKAYFDMNNIKDEYKFLHNSDSINSVTYYKKLLENTDLNYHFCRDMKDDLQYPAFYPTGIHWSRTFEQYNTSYTIKRLAEITNKKYRNIILKEVKKSNVPYWRDADVYELLNIWVNPSNIEYYEYETSFEELNKYDAMNFIIQGDSFGDGLRHDILDLNSTDNVYYINRDNYIIDLKDNAQFLNQQWASINLAEYLDKADVIILEATEPEITSYQFGFVDYMIAYLDKYKVNGE